MTFESNAAALRALLNAALPAQVRVFDLDKVVTPRPHEYVELSLSRVVGGNFRVSGQLYTTGYRFSLGAISDISIDNVRATIQTCNDAVEGNRLIVGDRTSTPIRFETDDAPEPDNGRFTGYRFFTYVIRD